MKTIPSHQAPIEISSKKPTHEKMLIGLSHKKNLKIVLFTPAARDHTGLKEGRNREMKK